MLEYEKQDLEITGHNFLDCIIYIHVYMVILIISMQLQKLGLNVIVLIRACNFGYNDIGSAKIIC